MTIHIKSDDSYLCTVECNQCDWKKKDLNLLHAEGEAYAHDSYTAHGPVHSPHTVHLHSHGKSDKRRRV